MTPLPPIPPDLSPTGEWHGRALRRIGDPLLRIAFTDQVFAVAQAMDAKRAELRASRKHKQTILDLED
jgi:hypothetical protein